MKFKTKSRRSVWSKRKLAEKMRMGHGQGTGANYQPWIRVRDLSSKGTSTRMFSPKTGRTMHFLSNVERDTFLIAEFRADFQDYWEQWPLDPVRTTRVAERLGHRHPIYIGTRIPVVMTVDGILTQRRGDGIVRKAIDCKYSDFADNPRTLEKLAITQATCEEHGLLHVVTTEKQADPQTVKNILWVRMAVPRTGEREPVPDAFGLWPRRMHTHLVRNQGASPFADMPLNAYCQWFEQRHALPRGLGLRLMKLLMWHHLVEFDISTRAPELLPIGALSVRPIASLFGSTKAQSALTEGAHT